MIVQNTKLAVKHIDSIISADETLELVVDTVIAPLENNILSSYIEAITSLYYWYKDFLSTLTLEQIGAVIHLSSIASIVLCLFTIIATLYGDFLIKYFKLEEKYPKLARFIQLRRKIKMYSVVFNFFLIFLVLLFLTYFNLYILFKV